MNDSIFHYIWMTMVCLICVLGIVWCLTKTGEHDIAFQCQNRGYFVSDYKLYKCQLFRELKDE